jgi:hypothetical protein
MIAETSYKDEKCGVHAFLLVPVLLLNQFNLDVIWHPRKGSLSHGMTSELTLNKLAIVMSFLCMPYLLIWRHYHRTDLLINFFSSEVPKLYRVCHWHSSVGCLLHLQQTQGRRRRTTQSAQ